MVSIMEMHKVSLGYDIEIHLSTPFQPYGKPLHWTLWDNISGQKICFHRHNVKIDTQKITSFQSNLLQNDLENSHFL